MDLSLAAQTTAFLQAEVAAIQVMPLAEQASVGRLLPACLIDVLSRAALHRTNLGRPNLLQARLVDL